HAVCAGHQHAGGRHPRHRRREALGSSPSLPPRSLPLERISMTEDRRYTEQDLVEFATACFRAYDVSALDAHIAAEALVAADLRGVHSHGLLLLARYCNQLKLGGVVARPDFRVVRESAATALVDGGAGLGQVSAVKVM